MELTYRFADDSSLTDVAFDGLNGREYVTSTKDALNVMKIRNPAVGFQESVKAGAYYDISDEEYEQVVDTIRCISALWHYPDDPKGSKAQPEMNILALLANAIEQISRLNAEMREYRDEQ